MKAVVDVEVKNLDDVVKQEIQSLKKQIRSLKSKLERKQTEVADLTRYNNLLEARVRKYEKVRKLAKDIAYAFELLNEEDRDDY